MSRRTHTVRVRFYTDIKDLNKAEKELERLVKRKRAIESKPVKVKTDRREIEQLNQGINRLEKNISQLRVKASQASAAMVSGTNKAIAVNRTAIQQSRVRQSELVREANLVRLLRAQEDRRVSVLNRTRRALGQSFMEAPLYSASFALMAAISMAIQKYVEFDKVITRIAIVGERNLESMRVFAEYANTAGRALGVTGKAFAEASLIFIQQGGLASDYAAQLATSTIKLANITGESAADISEYLTAIANSFKLLETDGAAAGERIADVLARLDAISGSSANEISEAFKRAASSFAAAGFTLEESAAILSVVSETTRQTARMVGTGFKTLIGNLNEVRIGTREYMMISNKLNDINKRFGLSISLIDDFTGDMRKTPDLLRQVARAYNSTTSIAAKNAIIEAVAGKEQRDRFIALMENQERYNYLLDQAQKSTGAAEYAQALYMDSIGGKIEQLKNEWERFTHAIIDNQAFKKVLDTLISLTEQINTLGKTSSGVLAIWTKIAAVVIPLMAMRMMGPLGLMNAGAKMGIATNPQGRGISRAPTAAQLAGTPGSPAYGMGMAGMMGGSYLLGSEGRQQYRDDQRIIKQYSGVAGREKEVQDARARATAQQQQARQIAGGRAAIAGVGLGLAATSVAATFKNEDLTNAEKGLKSVGALAPAIGMLFGPWGMLIGIVISLAATFMSTNKAMSDFRSEVKKVSDTAKESLATSPNEKRVESLLKIIEETTKGSEENIKASNELAELLPAVKIGTDNFGNAIIDTVPAIRDYIKIVKASIEIQKNLNAQKEFESYLEVQRRMKGQAERDADAEARLERFTKTGKTEHKDMGGYWTRMGKAFMAPLNATAKLQNDLYKNWRYQEPTVKGALKGTASGFGLIGNAIWGTSSAVLAGMGAALFSGVGGKAFRASDVKKDLGSRIDAANAPEKIIETQAQEYVLSTKREKAISAAFQEIMKEEDFFEITHLLPKLEKTKDLDITQFKTIEEISAYLAEKDGALEELLALQKAENEALKQTKEYVNRLETAPETFIFRSDELTKEIQKTTKGFELSTAQLLQASENYFNTYKDYFENLNFDAQMEKLAGFNEELNNLGKDIRADIGIDMGELLKNLETPEAVFQRQVDIMKEYIIVKKFIDDSMMGLTITETAFEGIQAAAANFKFLKLDVEKIGGLMKSDFSNVPHLVREIILREGLNRIVSVDTDAITTPTSKVELTHSEEVQRAREVHERAVTNALRERLKVETDLGKTLEQSLKGEADRIKLLQAELKYNTAMIEANKQLSGALGGLAGKRGVLRVKPEGRQVLAGDPGSTSSENFPAFKDIYDIYSQQASLQKENNSITRTNLELLFELRVSSIALNDDAENYYQIQRKTTKTIEDNVRILDELVIGSDRYNKSLNTMLESHKESISSNLFYLEELQEKAATEAFRDDQATLDEIKKTMDEITKSRQEQNKIAKELALQEYNYILFNTRNVDELKERYETLGDLVELLLDAHEQMVEQSLIELDIRKEIESTTNSTYKANLRFLQNQMADLVKEGRFNKQAVETTKARLKLLKEIESINRGNTGSDLKLSRTAEGSFRYSGSGTSEEKRLAILSSINQEQDASLKRLQEYDQKIFSLTQQLPGIEDPETALAVRNMIEELQVSKVSEASFYKDLTAAITLAEKGQAVTAQNLILGRIKYEDLAGALTPEELAAIEGHTKAISSTLITDEMMLVKSNGELRDAINALKEALGAYTKALKEKAYLDDRTLRNIQAGDIASGTGSTPKTDQQIYDEAVGGPGDPKGRDISEEDKEKAWQAHVRATNKRNQEIQVQKDIWNNAHNNASLTNEEKKAIKDAAHAEANRIRSIGTDSGNTVDANGFLQLMTRNKFMSRFNTGGYTGDFDGGRLAVLHEKELVLNKMDTQNILKAVAMLRPSVNMSGLNRQVTPLSKTGTEGGQNVVINASFPGVSSSEEIQRAFKSMSTKALQYAYRTKSY